MKRCTDCKNVAQYKLPTTWINLDIAFPPKYLCSHCLAKRRLDIAIKNERFPKFVFTKKYEKM